VSAVNRDGWTARRGLETRERRTLGALALLLVVAVGLSLSVGSTFVDPARVIGALIGTEDGGIRLLVVEWRLPRALAAVAFGAALGLSGLVFQTITRNELGSPDVIGLTTGAYTGALVVITSGSGSGTAVTVGALVGGFATAAVVAALVAGRGDLGYRIVIIGIGVSAVLASVNAWMLLRARLEVAISASIWGSGSLNGVGWSQLRTPLLVIGVLGLLLLCARRGIWALQLGDDLARGLGTRVTATKVGLLALAVGLTAVVTAAAGPIAFVALAAPHLAAALVRPGPVHLAATALLGAALLTVADVVGQHAIPGRAIPVGLVTLVLGGAYLIWFVLRSARRLT